MHEDRWGGPLGRTAEETRKKGSSGKGRVVVNYQSGAELMSAKLSGGRSICVTKIWRTTDRRLWINKCIKSRGKLDRPRGRGTIRVRVICTEYLSICDASRQP